MTPSPTGEFCVVDKCRYISTIKQCYFMCACMAPSPTGEFCVVDKCRYISTIKQCYFVCVYDTFTDR